MILSLCGKADTGSEFFGLSPSCLYLSWSSQPQRQLLGHAPASGPLQSYSPLWKTLLLGRCLIKEWLKVCFSEEAMIGLNPSGVERAQGLPQAHIPPESPFEQPGLGRAVWKRAGFPPEQHSCVRPWVSPSLGPLSIATLAQAHPRGQGWSHLPGAALLGF